MKKSAYPLKFQLLFVAAFLTFFVLTGCYQTVTETVYEAQTLTYTQLRSSVSYKTTELPEILNPGKIYLLESLEILLINEKNEGIHFVSLHDTSNPVQIGYLAIPGNIDMAVLFKADSIYLYADSFIDLVTFGVTITDNGIDPVTVEAVELFREENVFPNDPYQMFAEETEPINFEDTDFTDQVVIGYTSYDKEVQYPIDFNPFEVMTYDTAAMESGGDTGGSDASSGQGGSMARFTLLADATVTTGQYLYAVTESDMPVFKLDDNGDPRKIHTEPITWGGVETIFYFDSYLYIGSDSAMYIYNISGNNAAQPIQEAEVTHFTSKDPVVVGMLPGDSGGPDVKTAFVTLHEDDWGWGVNQLLAFDVDDPKNVGEAIIEKTMERPYGLAIVDTILFVCDGDTGVKAYDVSDLHNSGVTAVNDKVEFIGWGPEVNTYDVIPYLNSLLVVGENGFYIYDYSIDANAADPNESLTFTVTGEILVSSP